MTEEDVVTQDQANAETVENQPEKEAPDAGKEQAADTEGQAEQPEEGKQSDEPKKKPWFVERIDKLGARNAEYRRQIEDFQRREAEWQRQQQQPEQPQDDGRRQQQGNVPRDEVERRAAEIAEQRAFQSKLQQWDSRGRSEFPDFVDRCNAVANMGASERPDFMQIVADLADGHKVVAHLADHPDEAMRILGLPGHSMAFELGRLSSQGFAPKRAPTSAAPRPIRPLAGAGKVETDPSKMSMDEWMKWREKQNSA